MLITYKIHLIRTGNTTDDENRPYVGQLDLPLAQSGQELLAAMKEQFGYPKVQLVYTSPLKRTVETADILFPDNQVIPIDALKDMNLGDFQGKTFKELEFQEDFVKWINNSAEYAPPGGESTLEFTKRIIGAINGIFFEMMNQKLTNVAVITHGGVIMSLLANIGLPKAPPQEWLVENGTGFTLMMTPSMWMRDHLGEVTSRVPTLKDEESYDLGMW